MIPHPPFWIMTACSEIFFNIQKLCMNRMDVKGRLFSEGEKKTIPCQHKDLKEFHLKQVEQKICNLFYRRRPQAHQGMTKRVQRLTSEHVLVQPPF